MVGMCAISKSGHDKGMIYIILREDGEYVYLVDGKFRPLEKPKKKNKKHIQLIKKYQDADITNKILWNQPIYNEEIRKAIGGIYV